MSTTYNHIQTSLLYVAFRDARFLLFALLGRPNSSKCINPDFKARNELQIEYPLASLVAIPSHIHYRCNQKNIKKGIQFQECTNNNENVLFY
jgi:hypothetical protein